MDLLVAQRITDANAEIKKQMLHLVASEIDEQLAADDAAAGDPSENELAGLFAQVETIQARLKQVKAQCFEFATVAQAEMDRMCVDQSVFAATILASLSSTKPVNQMVSVGTCF